MSGSAVDRLVPAVLRVALVGAAVTFLLAAPLHLGVRIAGLVEPRIIPTAVVESLCGVCLAVATIGVFAHATWVWSAALTAHVVHSMRRGNKKPIGWAALLFGPCAGPRDQALSSPQRGREPRASRVATRR